MQPIKIPLLAAVVSSVTTGDFFSDLALWWPHQAPSSCLAIYRGARRYMSEETHCQNQNQTNELKGCAEASRRV